MSIEIAGIKRTVLTQVVCNIHVFDVTYLGRCGISVGILQLQGEAVDIVLEYFRFGKQFAELNRRISGECVTWQKKLLGLEFWNKAVGLDFDISIAELDFEPRTSNSSYTLMDVTYQDFLPFSTVSIANQPYGCWPLTA